MQGEPLLTIGMPVFQGERHLAQALESLLAQTFRDFEIVISDNDSKDATQSICERYARQDARIRYVRLPENIGVAGNFRNVLSMASAPYFMWAACDDLWDSNWVEKLIAIAGQTGNLAMGSVRQVDEGGQAISALVNSESFTYAGSRIQRRIRFFLRPSMSGKANAIYSLGPRDAFPTGRVALLDVQGGDMAFVYCELEQTPIVWCPDVALSKRTPVIRPKFDPGIKGVTQVASALAAARQALNLGLYLQESSPFEKLILVVASPLGLVRILLATRKRFRLAVAPQ